MQKKSSKKQIAALIILILSNILLLFAFWLMQKYDYVFFEEVLYQLKSPTTGTYSGIALGGVLYIGVYSSILSLAEVLLYLFISGGLRSVFKKWQGYVVYSGKKIARFFYKIALPISLFLLISVLSLFVARFRVIQYIRNANTESYFIEQNYVDPNTVSLQFPEQKRNLIYIFLESVESTYSEFSLGDEPAQNLIPNLTRLAQENVHFSHNEGLGGATAFNGTTWTAAAMVAQTSGVNIKVPFAAKNYGGKNDYLSGLTSIGEILQAQGYHQTLLIGSDAAFAGRDTYFTDHGNYEILDVNSLKSAGRLDADYHTWWGFEDEKLFAYAKEELLKLAEQGKPFNLTMLTADSHMPDGYVCDLCANEEDTQYANVLRCTDRQVEAFVRWVQDQSFYENTTIVLVGDHLTMDPLFLKGIDKEYQRTTYNCIINGAAMPVSAKNRVFGTFDMFPTTLAALGVQIEGDRLGLGTNLYADLPTLAEIHGKEALNEELQKKSTFYNQRFLGMK